MAGGVAALVWGLGETKASPMSFPMISAWKNEDPTWTQAVKKRMKCMKEACSVGSTPRQETYYWGAGFCDHQPRCGAENIQGVELGKAVASMVIHGYSIAIYISLGFIGIC